MFIVFFVCALGRLQKHYEELYKLNKSIIIKERRRKKRAKKPVSKLECYRLACVPQWLLKNVSVTNASTNVCHVFLATVVSILTSSIVLNLLHVSAHFFSSLLLLLAAISFQILFCHFSTFHWLNN